MAKTRADLFEFLASLGIATTTAEHPPLHTVEESRALRGRIQGGHTKNLFVKDKKGTVFLIVAEETRDVDLKVLHKTIGAQGRLSFAGSDQMRALLGVAPGSVTAFGVINDENGIVRVVLDEGLLVCEALNCHPLTNEATTTIATDDLLAFLAATGHTPLIVALDAAPAAADASVSASRWGSAGTVRGEVPASPVPSRTPPA